MMGRIEETSASFEARSAPRSYPTISDMRRSRFLQRNLIPEPYFAGGKALV
jgi:hypothetical protein